MSQPQIVIDPDEELRIVCRLLFYNIPGFHPNAKKLHKACQEEGYSFQLQDITKWVKYQYSYQIYQQPLPCKAEASFSKIKIPNKVHQCDILLHTHNDQDGRRVFVCSLLVIDVAMRYKEGRSLTSRNSLEIWIAIKEIYEDPSNPLTWPTLLMTDAFKKNLAKLIYNVQYAIEGRLAKGERSRLWNKILKKYIDFMNNSKTRLIGMSPARAMTLEEVESKPSSKAKRAIGRHEEIKLKKGIAIKRVVIGRNPPQPVLYYLENEPIESTAHLMGRNPKRPFKFEELQVIEEPDKIEYPPDEFMRKYHDSRFIHFTRIADNKLTQAEGYAKRRGRLCLGKTGQINGHDIYLWSYKNGAHQWEYPLKIPTDIRENATHIVLFSGGGSTRKFADIISPYTDADPHKDSKVINGYLRQKEFVVIDINKPRSESFSLRWDTPLNLEKEIESLGKTSN
ncbi:uncharacterized protein OCT59_001141 [Rhizophagus irregularis]|uniref:uncharacterized protein n=1 Tax=Rhizophagus irregularis TaxID=588596 RepID=UPI0033235603|nr:hypothetical protein OCT59_001141 [Rhizophagus irregularis]